MKSIDFTKVPVIESLDDDTPTNINMAKHLGNYIYKNAMTLEMDALARRIYSSAGPVDLTDEEAKYILDECIVRLPYRIRVVLHELLK